MSNFQKISDNICFSLECFDEFVPSIWKKCRKEEINLEKI